MLRKRREALRTEREEAEESKDVKQGQAKRKTKEVKKLFDFADESLIASESELSSVEKPPVTEVA